MKPCPQNKKPLTLLALGALCPERAIKLRRHLESCPGCRRYHDEAATVVRNHEHTADAMPDVRVSESFHRRLDQRIQADMERPGVLRIFETFWRRIISLNRAALGAAAALLITGLVFIWPNPKGPLPDATGLTMSTSPPHEMESTEIPPPTLSAYRTAINISPEALDELLAQHAARSSPAPGVKTFYAFRRATVEN